MLVNNAANFYAGYFEELTPEQMERQLMANLIGPMNVTRAVLPVMRKQRSGHVVAISSSAGFAGFEFCTAYAASKFGVEGFMESLAPRIEPFGIHTTIVEPGFFRTELLTDDSTGYAEGSIDDYAERSVRPARSWKAMNGKQTAIPPSSQRRCSRSSSRSSRRGVSSPAPTPTEPSSRKPTSYSRRIDAYRELSDSLSALDEVGSSS